MLTDGDVVALGRRVSETSGRRWGHLAVRGKKIRKLKRELLISMIRMRSFIYWTSRNGQSLRRLRTLSPNGGH